MDLQATYLLVARKILFIYFFFVENPKKWILLYKSSAKQILFEW